MSSADLTHDVIIIGGGLAGCLCAARLAQAGVKRIALISDRPGATALHYGPWALGQAALAPLFPALADAIPEAVTCAAAGLEGLALVESEGPCLDVEGLPRAGELAPATHAAQAALPEGSAVVDLAPLGQPFASLIRFERPEMPEITLQWPAQPGAFGRSFTWAAGLLERPEAVDAFADTLGAAVEAAGIPGVLLPPVLGLRDPQAVAARIQSRIGVPVAEAVGGSPSTAGLRLHMALSRWMTALGVTQITAEVSGVDTQSLTVATSEGHHRAEAVVVATGGLISGGLRELEEGLDEPLLDVPIAPRLPADALTVAAPGGPWGGPLFRAGLPVDQQMRPVRPDGQPAHPGLFAAGDVIASGDPVLRRWASGLAIGSGWLAAGGALSLLGVTERVAEEVR